MGRTNKEMDLETDRRTGATLNAARNAMCKRGICCRKLSVRLSLTIGYRSLAVLRYTERRLQKHRAGCQRWPGFLSCRTSSVFRLNSFKWEVFT